ncbi:MAG: toll/interleukin-1 receptor domain-containing protein [Chthoniobacter sp.]|nr:toll/interleukin-1 receptor domain-containing protein [Chthoniobacter sp.]
MHPRWRPDHHGAPLVPDLSGDRGSGGAEREFINEPLPDLEQQLAAELEGACWAVVAFAPEDAIWCDWIYRHLNGYRLPTSLVDRVTTQGIPRPDCLSIFPDRRDPAYTERVARALADSSYLIVVCSPHSAKSEVVDDQIRAFKKTGGEERILVLVADGPPDARLGEHRRAAQCDWLPAWLRWRLEENGFRAADRAEPRVVDARRGYRSLKQVRDSLLSALVDIDAAELERLGGCAAGIELVPLPEPPRKERIPVVTTAVATSPPAAVSRKGSKYTIFTAVMLILVAIVFGTRSFLEITAEEPVSTLDVSPVTGAMAGRSLKVTPAEETTATPATQDTASAVTPETTPTQAVAQSTPPAADPAPAPAVKAPAPATVALPNVPQVTPPSAWATSRILPADSQPPPRSGSVTTAISVVTPPSGGPSNAGASAATNTESDAVLLDEVRTLERRGDETMAEKRTEDALDLYHTALNSAEEYAARKGANPNARDQLVALRRKLGLLQMQNSSTAEARATYTQARRTLLQLKSQNQWNRERAKALDEIESRLLSLPRD